MVQEPILIWVCTPLIIYLAFFLLGRRPSAIRLSRVGQLVVLFAIGNILLSFIFVEAGDQRNWPVFICCMLIGICFWRLSRITLVRLAAKEFQELVQTGSARLLLQCEIISSRELVLTGRNRTASIHSFSVAPRILLVLTPTVRSTDKITLLLQWLPKVMPGPLPRIRIALKRKSVP